MTTNEREDDGDHIEVGNITNAQAVAVGPGATAIYQGLSVDEVAVLFTEWKRADQPVVWNGRIPYIGLSAFQESDAQYFFGRESLVDDLLERVQKASFIVIAGPSGSGKSSVARAGLFHALRNGRLLRSDQWQMATMIPGSHPLDKLAHAIEQLTQVIGSGDYLRQNGAETPDALHRQAEIMLIDDPRQRFVLFIDQFEELFTQTKDETERAAFIRLLTTSALMTNGRLIIILSLRSDFISHCARYPDLRELLNQQFMLVGAMEAPDLAKAITLPALEVGAEIDSALVSRIMADMKGEPGTLPLMSFALRDLFEFEAQKTKKGQPLNMTLPDYLARGGVEEALERHADQVFQNFTAEQQTLAKTVFSRLVEVGQGRVDTRRTAEFNELVPAGQRPAQVTQVIDALAREGARLLTASGGDGQTGDATATVTIAHEKLIDAWPWLRQLVDDNREAIRMQNEIAQAAQQWLALNKDPGTLYRGAKLQQAIEWFEQNDIHLTPLAARFIGASHQEIEREAREKEAQRQRELQMARQLTTAQTQAAQRLRWAVWALAGVMAAMLIIIGILVTPYIQEQWAKSVTNTDMAFIPAGPVVLGTDDPDIITSAFYREGPAWTTTLPAFRIDKYKVTNWQYSLCHRYGPCILPLDQTAYSDEEKVDHPVVNITVYQANTYCQWLGKRLPTELEWVRAATGPNSERLWPWGNEPPTIERVNMADPVTYEPTIGTQPVTTYSSGATPEGIFQLVGNVSEWTSSLYQNAYDRDKDPYDPTQFWDGQADSYSSTDSFVQRGGDWVNGITYITTWFPEVANNFSRSVGFRCVQDVD